VSNLFLHIGIISIHWYIGCLHEIEIKLTKQNYSYLIGQKNNTKTKTLNYVF